MSDLKRKILLNPGPGTTSNKVKQALVVDDICPREEEFGNLMLEICEGLLKIGNAKPSYEVGLFAASGTGAVEATLISSIPNNSKVLIVTNGTYGKRMSQICANYGIAFDEFGSFGEYPDLDKLKNQLSIDDYSHLAFTHHETSTGMLNQLEAIVNICIELNVKTIVDAMSSFGAYPMDLESLQVDYVIASSNKCIQGMAGLSFVIFKNSNLEELKANSRGFYLDLYGQWENLQRKKQLRFTPPVQICYAFMQAIKDTLEEGVESRWNRYVENWSILYQGLTELGFKTFLPKQQESQILMALRLEHSNIIFNDLHDFLYENDITIYPGVIPECNTFRVAIIGDLNSEDMEKVVAKFKEYFAQKPLIYLAPSDA